MHFFNITEIINIDWNIPKSWKTLVIFLEKRQNQLKNRLLHCEFYWNQTTNLTLYPLFRKDHWWAVMGSCPSLSITGHLSMHFFYITEITFFHWNWAKSCKTLLIFMETWQNQVKNRLFHCEFESNQIKKYSLSSLFRKDHWWTVMGSCPSLSITGHELMHFFNITEIINIDWNIPKSWKTFVIFLEKWQNQLKNRLLHCEFYWNHTKNQTLYSMFGRTIDGQWWAAAHHCPSLAISWCISLTSQKS